MSGRVRTRRTDAVVAAIAIVALAAAVGLGIGIGRAIGGDASGPASAGRPGTAASDTAPPAPEPPRTADGAATAAPWPAPSGLDAVSDRVEAAELSLGKVSERFHIHSHLTVTLHGEPVTVPGGIGIAQRDGKEVYSPLHTHETDGIIHVEAPAKRAFSLGQVFTEWDVALGVDGSGATTVGAYGAASGDTVTLFVDGVPTPGDPAALTLRNLQNIDIVITRPGETPVAPGGFYWPPNY